MKATIGLRVSEEEELAAAEIRAAIESVGLLDINPRETFETLAAYVAADVLALKDTDKDYAALKIGNHGPTSTFTFSSVTAQSSS